MAEQPPMSPAVPKPDHVPDAVVYDFDLHKDPDLMEDAHARILQLVREAPPVFWTPRNGGHWMIQGHAEVMKASKDWDTFTSEFISMDQLRQMNASLPEGAPKIYVATPINLDPPLHSEYRQPLLRPFAPKTINALKDDIRSLASDLIGAVKDTGRCEFMRDIAEPLPVQVFLKMFGLPLERQREYRDLVDEHMRDADSSSEGVMRRTQRVAAIMEDTILERRDNPRDDLISMLWETEVEGREPTLYDIQNYCVLLFIAGLDTVMNGMGHNVRHLAMNLDLQRDLRDDPSLIKDAVEEMLRRYTFTVPPRLVKADCEFEGVTMKAGERAMLFLPSADLDAREFKAPEAYDLARESLVHIAFGAGPHRCLGSHLARVELNILTEELMKALPEFRLDDTKPIRFHGGHVIGPDELHLVW